jgi:hypothetical protein
VPQVARELRRDRVVVQLRFPIMGDLHRPGIDSNWIDAEGSYARTVP